MVSAPTLFETPLARRFWSGALGVAATILGVGALGTLFADAGGRDTPWRDLDRARAELSEARSAEADARRELDAASVALADAEAANAEVLAAEADRVRQLESAAATAERLAIEAYIGGTALDDLLLAIDTPDAAAAAYRVGLVTTQASTLAESSELVAELRAEISPDARNALAAIDDARTRLDEATATLADATDAVTEAEFVVEVAAIHDEADQMMVDNGFTEPTAEQWRELRWCESRETYDIDTGNGYFGAYQFDLITWVGVGGSGNPAHARPEEQDARARWLYALRGDPPWPICGQYLPG